jgi:hypothetical protein
VQQALPGDWDVMSGYVGSRGRNLFRIGDANLAPERSVNGVKTYQPALGRRNPNFVGIWQRVTDGESFYNSLQVAANKRYSKGFARRSPTRWRARSTTRAGSTRRISTTTSSTCSTGTIAKFDRGPSAFNVTHNLTFNWTWDIPSGSITGVRAVLLKGWQFNNYDDPDVRDAVHGQARVQPLRQPEHDQFLDERAPNLKPGCDPVLGGPDRYWDVTCLRAAGGEHARQSGPHSLTGPGLGHGRRALVKSFTAGSARTLAAAPRRFQRVQPCEFRRALGTDRPFTGVERAGQTRSSRRPGAASPRRSRPRGRFSWP